ncbi:MAG TPA: fatty acid desaturase [Allosphingosinicella sp.]|nr:fatty acid desaturase [Allosphingosinicella sp.]
MTDRGGSDPASRLVREVEWRDLVPMRRRDGVIECLHPVPWLLLSWGFAAYGRWAFAAAASFMFFLTALRLNHEAIHRNLGFGAAGHRRVIHALSALMLGSNHAVAFNHLQHHAHVGRPSDVEGKCGRMSGWEVLAYGPIFPVELHRAAWRRGNARLRGRMRVDFGLNALVLAAALLSGSAVLRYHVLVMAVAQCLTGFFAVWITHHGCHGETLVARTQRSRLVNFATYNMFFHLEHHVFPAVPVKRLGRLAARIDAAFPQIIATARRVI